VRVHLPLAHRGGPVRRLLQVWQPLSDASGLAQEAIDGATGARQALPTGRQVCIARQIVEKRFWSRRASQAFRRLVAHLEDAVDHHLADALRGALARPRLALQDRFIVGRRFSQAFAPFLDPTQRHAHRLGILLARPGGIVGQQTTQVRSGGVVYCFHVGTLLGRQRLSFQECTFFLPSVATMSGNTWGYDVSNSYRGGVEKGGDACVALGGLTVEPNVAAIVGLA
jgi:hypothetical protein